MTPTGAPVAGFLGGAVSHLVGSGAEAVLGGLSDAVAGAAGAVMSGIGAALAATTRPELGAAWFEGQYARMAGLAAAGLFVVLPVACAQAVLRGDPRLLVRSVLVQLPLAVALTVSAVWLVNLGLAAVDAMCAFVSHDGSDRVAAYVGRMATSLPARVATGGQPPVFLTLLFALVVVVGGFVLWLEMVVRSAAIDAATLFLPIALVGLVWPAASHWARRLAEVLAALVLSKFVVVGTLSLGAAAVDSGGGAAPLLGMALLLLAATAPLALLRLIPLADFGAVAHLAGMGRRAALRGPATAWTLGNQLGELVSAGVAGPPPVPSEGSDPAVDAAGNYFLPIEGLTHPFDPRLDGTAPGREPPSRERDDGVAGPGPHADPPPAGAGPDPVRMAPA